MATLEPDLILLDRYRRTRDARAFAEIVHRYAGAVYATCHRILRDPGSAEDAAQETFFRLMTRPQRVTSSVGGWLHRAATRLALDIQRSEASRRRREAEYENLQSLEASTWAEVAPKLDVALAALPEEPRELLVRHFLRGESQAELAAEAGTSPATLSRRMKDAVDALRQEMLHRGLSVSPLVLFKLLSQNGVCGAPAALKLGLGKMALLCRAHEAGIRLPASVRLIRGLISAPRAVYQVRWALAAAIFSLLVALLGSRTLSHIQIPHGPAVQPEHRIDADETMTARNGERLRAQLQIAN